MMPIIYLQLLLITLVTALACVIPGNFLILRGNALMSDALSHAILFGIVITFLLVQDINSPLIFLGAIIAGIITVSATQALTKIGHLHQDAAIGLTFPFLFSIAVILINIFADNVHLDTDAILLGELAFAPFEKLYIFNHNCGPVALWNMSIILCMNIFSVLFFYKELIISTFDPAHAKLMNYHPNRFHYLLMILTSITIIQAFHITGTILVISFIVTPAATAYLLTKKLSHMITLSCMLAIIAVLSGFLLAHEYNTSIAGAITVMNGVIFFCVMLFQKIAGKN
ncbi:metal ABC transporter permease [Candidatus Babeliales bacterium]|nr:metal ABC transporter permease [Candidatus Babeliales bacterium]MBP9844221.1 metal ABC transporter permease [Candidatus Babeliales bacterium]